MIPKIELVKHNLDGVHDFYVGRVPKEELWDQAMFDAAWSIHPLKKHLIMIHGRLVETPRFQQAYGADYHYTGNDNIAVPVPKLLARIMAWGQENVDPRFNGLLLNWYEGPDHYIGPHHDSTKNMIEGCPILTVSYGETRVFRLSKKMGEDNEARDFPAPHGTVFLMPYDTNLAWKHGVPKSTKYAGRRISVTFRGFETGVLAPTRELAATQV